jgi:hypothetical protein
LGRGAEPRPLSPAASHARRTSECAGASRILSFKSNSQRALFNCLMCRLVTVLDAAQRSRSVTGRSRQQTNQVPTKPFPGGHEVSLKRTPAYDAVGSNNGVRSCWQPSSTSFTAKLAGNICPPCGGTAGLDGGPTNTNWGVFPMTSPLNVAIYAFGGFMLLALAIGFFGAPV